MVYKKSLKNIVEELGTQIENVSSNFSDIKERIPTVQVIPWIKEWKTNPFIIGEETIKDIRNKLQQKLKDILDDTYLFLQKKSSGDIVFSSWSLEEYEISKGDLNPQGIILAAQREFKEEMYGLLTIDQDNIVDLYPPIDFETVKWNKYIQFRLLVQILPDDVREIEKRFVDEMKSIARKYQEHDTCYIASYEQAKKYVDEGKRIIKPSTSLSLEYHNICKRHWKYS